MSESTNPVDDRILRHATLAADMWAMTHGDRSKTAAEYTRGLVTTAVTHLVQQGLLIVPGDIEQRLDKPLPMWTDG
jgi:hypothetical protein